MMEIHAFSPHFFSHEEHVSCFHYSYFTESVSIEHFNVDHDEATYSWYYGVLNVIRISTWMAPCILA